MHFGLTQDDELNADTDVYRTINFLVKITARNCLNNSGSGKGTRFMWNGGLFLILELYKGHFLEDQECELQLLPKITYEHVYLTAYFVMNVRLAAKSVKYNY